MLRILVKFQNTVQRVVETDKDQITVGRNLRNDIQIDNLAVSGFHARVQREMGHYFVEDLNSTNGTFVNDRRIEKWGLKDGDAVSIGKYTLIFMLEETGEGAGSALRELEMDRTVILEGGYRMSSCEDAEKRRVGVLKIVEGKTALPEYELTAPVTAIGRKAEAEIRMEGLRAPKGEWTIARGQDGYAVTPPEAGEVLRVNGRPLENGTLLQEGDQLSIGRVKMRFHYR